MTEEKSKEEEYFTTRDLNLAATLQTLKFPLIRIDYQVEGERQRPVGYFNFEDTTDLRDAERKFWAKDLSVEPREFVDNLRGLKTQLAGAYKNPHSRFSQ